jgi:hypothetical protein
VRLDPELKRELVLSHGARQDQRVRGDPPRARRVPARQLINPTYGDAPARSPIAIARATGNADSGTRRGEGDDEQIYVDLDRVPPEPASLVFTITSHRASAGASRRRPAWADRL